MIRREIYIFLIVGLLTTAVDFAIYNSLILLANFDINVSKSISFISGTLFAYVTNKNWTFSHKTKARKSIFKFFTLYFITLCVNVYFNSTFLSLFQEITYKIELAFIFSTIISAILNFTGMKLIIFNRA